MFESEYSDMFKSEETMWWYQGLRDIILINLSKYVSKKAQILDAGCGTGKTIQVLEKKGYDVKGIDYSLKAVNFCKSRRLKNVKHASILDIPYSRNSFDVVLCIDVLTVFSEADINRAIKESYRVLKPGGYFFLQCAALEFLRSQHDVVANIKKRYTKKELENYFKIDEWTMVKSSYRVFFLFPLLALFKIVKRLKNKKTSESNTDQVILFKPINELLTNIQLMENKLFQQRGLPIGSSLFMICQKK